MAENWCILYESSRSMRFNYARYSEHGVDMLATEFCLRGDFFFKLWLENNVKDQTFRYSLGDLSSYVENIPFIDWLLEQPTGSESYRRGQYIYIRTLLPASPV